MFSGGAQGSGLPSMVSELECYWQPGADGPFGESWCWGETKIKDIVDMIMNYDLWYVRCRCDSTESKLLQEDLEIHRPIFWLVVTEFWNGPTVPIRRRGGVTDLLVWWSRGAAYNPSCWRVMDSVAGLGKVMRKAWILDSGGLLVRPLQSFAYCNATSLERDSISCTYIGI